MHCDNCTADFTTINGTVYAQRVADPNTGTRSQIENECDIEQEYGQVFITCGVCDEVNVYPVSDAPWGPKQPRKGVTRKDQDTHLNYNTTPIEPASPIQHDTSVITNVEVAATIHVTKMPVGKLGVEVYFAHAEDETGTQVPTAVELTIRVPEGTDYAHLESLGSWLGSIGEVSQLLIERHERTADGEVQDIPVEESFGSLGEVFGREVTAVTES